MEQFHGWWYNTMIGSMNAFNTGGPFSNIQDQYIFIDTSSYPIQIHTTFGTDEFPRSKNIFDPQAVPILPLNNIPTGTSYYYKNNKLINGYNAPLSGSVDPILATYFGCTLQLINDKLYTFTYNNYNYFGRRGIGIYQRLFYKPRDTSDLDWDNPVNLFKYYISANSFSNISKNRYTGASNYVGEHNECKITESFFNQGFYKKTTVRKIRITNKKYYTDIGIKDDIWTTIYIDGFSYITPGSTVKIKGAKDEFAFLNGTYYNGVGLLNAGANLLLDPHFVDMKSYNNLFNSFLLRVDSSRLKANKIGWVTLPKTSIFPVESTELILPKGITVSVRHTISSTSTYAQFCASCAAWFYAVFQTATHVERNIYTYPNSCRVIDTFEELQTLLKDGTANQSFQDSMRYGQPFVSWYYHNFYDYRSVAFGDGLIKTGGLQNMVNCPFPVNYYNPLFKYDVVLGNYLINVHNLVFTIRGILQADQPHPSTFDYPFILDESAGRAHFEGLVVKANVKNGVIIANIPNNYMSMGSYHDDHLNVNAHYFGQIDPKLTNGRIIGYLYKRDCKFLDPLSMMDDHSIYSNEDPNTSTNPRISRESLSTVYSKMMIWFNDLGCEAIIIDQTGNLGGDSDLMSIIEFFGSDREVNELFSVPKDVKQCPLSYNDSNIEAAKQYQKSQYMYVSLNKKLYPGSVFQGKQVVLMTDIFSRSAGDISPNYMIGKGKKLGYLGNKTQAAVVGCMDGREFGFISIANSFPPGNKLFDRDGDQVTPFQFNVDWGQYYLKYSDKKLSQLQQNKEVNLVRLLPISFEKTVFADFGFIGNKSDKHDRKTWKYLYLDETIQYLIR